MSFCSSPYWYINQKRVFEKNLDAEVDISYEFIETTSIVSIGNDNDEDDAALCIDSISISSIYDYYGNKGMEHTPLELTNNWIGGNYDDKYLNAIIKYPICYTEVTEMHILYKTSITHSLDPYFIIPDGECVLEQRMDHQFES